MEKVYIQRTNLLTILVCILVAFIGALLIVLSVTVSEITEPFNSLLRDFGSVIIASVSIAVIWDFVSRRTFLKEVLSVTKLAEDIDETGLIGISPKWHGQINWPELFSRAKVLKVFFMYGNTWRNSNREYITKFAKKAGTKAIIVFPDYENQELMKQICLEVEYTPEKLTRHIKDAEVDFKEMFGNKNKLSIWHTSVFPIYSYYGFDHTSIVTFYSLDRKKVEVPTLMINNSGSLDKFFSRDFKSMLTEKDSISIKVFPKKS